MKKEYFFWIAVAILSVFLSCLAIDYDYDFFARLIVGEQFVEHGLFHFKDFLSYTPTHVWYDHEWGSGIVFYLVLKYFGASGIVFLQALLFFLITYFVVKSQQLQKHPYPVSLAFIAVFLVLLAKQNPTLIRCQSFSFLFFSMFLFMLEKYRKRNSKLIWAIPICIVVWNNLHGGIISGIGLILMYLTGALLEKKPFKDYIFVLFLSMPLMLINPYGFEYIIFVFSAATMNRKYITEWWPFFAFRPILYYLPMSIYGMFGWLLNVVKTVKTRKVDYTKLIVLTICLIQGLWHVKLLSITLIVTAVFCYNEFCRLFRGLKKKRKIIENSLYMAIFIIAFSIPFYSPQTPRISKNKMPITEVEFLKINNIKGNILAPFGLGSYISYKLYPDNLIYMDGRYEEVYNNKEFMLLRDFSLGEKDREDILNKYPTEIVMVSHGSIAYKNMYNNKHWTLVFNGRLCDIFVPKTAIGRKYIEPNANLKYYRDTAFDGYFGNKLRKDKK